MISPISFPLSACAAPDPKSPAHRGLRIKSVSRGIVRHGKLRGMSLVEVLVVMGIVAILAALLIPAVGKARQKTDAVKSAGNLRQIFVASQNWSADNDGRIVPCYSPSEGKAASARNYTGFLAPYLGIDTKLFTENPPADPFTLAPKMPVYVFPGHPKRFGYGYNYRYLSIINTRIGWDRNVPFVGAAHPGQTVFLVTSKSNEADDEAFSSWRAFVRSPSDGLNDHAPDFALPGGLAHVLWLDGHVTAEKKETLMADDKLWDLE